MKKTTMVLIVFIIAVLSVVCLSGCGKKNEAAKEKTVTADKESISARREAVSGTLPEAVRTSSATVPELSSAPASSAAAVKATEIVIPEYNSTVKFAGKVGKYTGEFKIGRNSAEYDEEMPSYLFVAPQSGYYLVKEDVTSNANCFAIGLPGSKEDIGTFFSSDDTCAVIFYLPQNTACYIGIDDQIDGNQVSVEYLGEIRNFNANCGNDVIIGLDIFKDKKTGDTILANYPVIFSFSTGKTLESNFWKINPVNLAPGKRTVELKIYPDTYSQTVSLHNFDDYVALVSLPDDFDPNIRRKEVEMPELIYFYPMRKEPITLDPKSEDTIVLGNGKSYLVSCTYFRNDDNSLEYFVNIYIAGIQYPYNSERNMLEYSFLYSK